MPDETTDQTADQTALEAAAAAEKAAAAELAALQAKADAEATAEAEAAEQRAANPMRFSAPNLIGGRIQGFDVGDLIRITDSAANDGVHTVARVESGWLVMRGAIRDEPPTANAVIAYALGDGNRA